MVGLNKQTVELPLDNLVKGEFPSVLALDPGGTTGWAFFDPKSVSVFCGQLLGEHHKMLWNHIEEWAPELIVCESFQFRQFEGFDKSKVVLDSVEYIGILKLHEQMYHTPLVFQTASTAKHFVADMKLQRMDWYKRTAGMVHARDALRHLLYHLVVTEKIREPITNRWFQRASGSTGALWRGFTQ